MKDCRKAFLDSIKGIVEYWTSLDIDKKEVGHGVAFSILCLLDGVSCDNLDGYEVIDNETNGRVSDYTRELHSDFCSGQY